MRATKHIHGVSSFGHGSMSYVLVLLSLITPLTCGVACRDGAREAVDPMAVPETPLTELVLGAVSAVAGLALVTVDAAAGNTNSAASVPGSGPFLQAEGDTFSTAGPPKMLRLLQQIADGTPDNNIYLGETTARALRKQLAVLPPDTSDWMKWQLRMQLGQEELRLGHEAEAIDHLRKRFCLSG